MSHRVLHVAHHAVPHLGGLETVVAAETRGLAARGWEVALVTSATATRPGTTVADGVRAVRVRAWNGLEERYGVPFPLYSPRLVGALAREVRRADVVHVHDVLYLTSWVAALWCRLLRTPYVVHRHVGFVHHSSALVRLVQAAVVATIGRFVLGGARVVLPIDEHVAASLPASARVEVLGNGVDTDRFHPGPRPDDRLPRVLFVGRFVPKKGFELVAAAADDAYEIAFAGGDRPRGLDDPRLTFLGVVPVAEMPDAYARADVMVVASVGECPLTVLEAMASGLPVLLREDPALHTEWTSGPGVRFVDMDAGDLRAALRTLVADRDEMRRLGEDGAAYARAAYSWDVHVDRLDRIYREATRP
ncbi:glycosyltransferase family 4 protein [Nocardioides mangrovi]|uniref:Glycosyltransferase family 4 protein n=1 Tax=Nocardioides mangrovi TaxID=2874580 RepID=A0ABS7U9K0_9ACTN|nr:glycosyltransferase family 4 protein [Nocardioides mangrovi]MBZ5737663.1 glycosyltransferase family 4 protein [Nocardioides mangrovi]